MKIRQWVPTCLYLAFVAWSLYGAVVPVETSLFRMVHLGLIFALTFVTVPFRKNEGPWLKSLDIVLAILGVVTMVFAIGDLDRFIRRSTVPDMPDFVPGIVAIVLLVEIARRQVGIAFTAVLVGFLLYAHFGHVLPGPLSHKGYDLDRIVGHMVMTLGSRAIHNI
jgi:TRAP-type uncharacterized transport system fused permease subunit